MRIALGIGGGIAAYKSAELARLLVQRNYSVRPVFTRAAEEFITPLTLATLTNQKPITALFDQANPEATLSSAVEHISVAQESDLLVVAPATAHLLAAFAHGLAHDFLSTLYLAFEGPVVLAPAMNTQMWEHPATRENLRILRERGHTIVAPGEGFLACGVIGPGRLAEPAEIAGVIDRLLNPVRDLESETVLITAGPTQEPLDPVRYISNHSSGKMGYALADAAARRGAHVVLVSGPVALEVPPGVDRVSVQTAQEMRDAVFARLAPATIVIACAAVADYRPATTAQRKIKKAESALTLELEPAPDILAELGRRKDGRLLIGFAAETENLREESARKLRAKNCDMVIGNLVGHIGTAFGSDDNQVVVVTSSSATDLPRASKRELADAIFDQIGRLRHRQVSGNGL